MQGKVEICGVNTARLKTLSQAQMDELLRKTKSGDENARQALIEGNLRLVLSVIQRFDKRGESPDDLFQVGCIGLMKAIANFDPDKQVKFSTYGVPMIAGEVRRYLRDNSAIRVSRSIRDVAYRVLQCKEALVTQLGREPTLEEISKALGEKDFEALGAKKYDGVKHEDVFNPEICEEIAKMPRGTISRWIEIDGWSFLIRKDGDVPGKKMTFAEAYDLVEENLRQKESKKAYDSWIERLRAENYVKVY
jgi:RNA polymerase sigma factor (sigma-70 family)